jgi:hypothetical protein
MDLMTQISESRGRSVKIQLSAAAFVQTLMTESDFHGVVVFLALATLLSKIATEG